MRGGMDKRSGQPWYPDAVAALEEEQEAKFTTDQELAALFFREFPLYFARYGEAEAGYADTLRSDTINADTLLLFNREIFNTFDLRDRLPSIAAPTTRPAATRLPTPAPPLAASSFMTSGCPRTTPRPAPPAISRRTASPIRARSARGTAAWRPRCWRVRRSGGKAIRS